MNKLIINIYDYFKKYPIIGCGVFLVIIVGLILSFLSLSYKEDISDFLPLDEKTQTALSVYQDISGADKIYAIISTMNDSETDPDVLTKGVEIFVNNVEAVDSLHYIKNIMKEIDYDKVLKSIDFIYENIPYFLNDKDYARIDSLLSNPEYIEQKISEDKESLLFPSSNVLVANISKDPLGLFSPILGRLNQSGMSINFETYDGYILSPDSKKAIVILESSFGAHESENNSKLVDMLNSAISKTEKENSNLDIHIIGGPVIAVSNANQIKNDSILAVCIAGLLILVLLIYVFRNARNILLIVVSVGWGWLFAMGGIALYYDSVSIIVIGIASVILGIAINYPLHLIDHLKDSEHPRAALKEIISPLVVGNITTVGAFLCLVPLNSPALHDLGVFSSLLLVGTILFVLIFLPHLVKTRQVGKKSIKEPSIIKELADVKLEKSKTTVCVVLILTIVFGYFNLKTEFDSDMRNINFMTPEQKSDMEYFQSLLENSEGTESLYIVSTGKSWDEALYQNELIGKNVAEIINTTNAKRQNYSSSFMISKEEQNRRLKNWEHFIEKNKGILINHIDVVSQEFGFNENAFLSFKEILEAEYNVQDFETFKDFINTVFVGSISENNDNYNKAIVQVLSIPSENINITKEQLSKNREFGGLFFDVKSMNGSIANTLSDDFNYIGFACGFIVFIFLWISLGSIELAIVSFLPMAFSWVWILGIMGILDIKFNIVNIILATFIFGQGDDYTIFITEGLSYEYAYRKKLLASYKMSIVVSALIMFIGIGTLLFAKHPALRSLGEVTVVGMISVVVMAYLFPPLIFNWLVYRRNKVRYRPITLKKLINTGFCAAVFITQISTAYILGFFMFKLTKPSIKKRTLMHKYCCSVFRWDVKRMPGLKYQLINNTKENFSSPAIIISNHQSFLDTFYLMTVNPKIILVANDHVKYNIITGVLFRWLGFVTVGNGSEKIAEKLRPYIKAGYSVAIFPEGDRPERPGLNIRRFHKGFTHLSSEFKLDILPIYLYGIGEVMPKGSIVSNGGNVSVAIGKRISRNEIESLGDTVLEQTKRLRVIFKHYWAEVYRRTSTVINMSPCVYDKYRYKGFEIERQARKNLKTLTKYADVIENRFNSLDFKVKDISGQGELALLLSLLYPTQKIYCNMEEEDSKNILKGCIENFASNVTLISDEEYLALQGAKYNDITFNGSEVFSGYSTHFNLRSKVINI